MRSSLFARREIADAVTEVAVSLLQVKHNRIVNAGVDVFLRKRFLQRLPVLNPHYVEVIDSLGPRWLLRRRHVCTRLGEKLVVLAGMLAATLVPFRQILQFHPQNACLQRIEPSVIAFDIVVILLGLPMVANHFALARDRFVIRRNRAPFSARTKVLAGIETERRSLTHGAALPPPVLRLREILA